MCIKFSFKFLILLAGLWHALAAKYDFVSKAERIHQRCPQQEKEEQSFFGLRDVAKSHFVSDSIAIDLAGKLILTWNIKPTVRIQANLDIHQLENDNWKLTKFSKTYFNFCQVHHNIQTTCNNGDNHNLQLVPHNLNISLNANDVQVHTLYKVVFTFKAFDLLNIEPTEKICFEINGRFRQNGNA